jgi:hypothetical protein
MLRPSVRPRRAPRSIYTGEALVVGEFLSVCVAIWRGEVSRAPFERQRAGLAEVVERHPRGAGFLCVIEPTAMPPSDELRRASIDMVASHGERLKCVACTIEGAGFKAAVARSVLSGMALLFANRKTPVSFFANVSEAVVWMSDRLPLEPLADAMVSIGELRALLAPFRKPP